MSNPAKPPKSEPAPFSPSKPKRSYLPRFSSSLRTEYASAIFSVRAQTHLLADETLQRVLQCAQAAATATGAQLNYTIKPGYAEMIPNATLARVFADNLRQINVPVHDRFESGGMASTDMGNVSHAIPCIQPYIAIAPEGTPGHTIQFRQAAISPAGHAGMIDAAKSLALTSIDLLAQSTLIDQARWEFQRTMALPAAPAR